MGKYLGVLGWVFLALLALFVVSKKPISKVVVNQVEGELNIAKEGRGHALENHFVIVVPSYNNEAYVDKNIGSICSQTYTNFEVIYVDDCSTDRTYQTVIDMIQRLGVEEKFRVIENSKNRMAMYNLHRMIHMCKPDDIVVILDGDDWFANDDALAKLNRYYANEDVWMTYGQYVRYPDYARGCSAPVLKSYIEMGDIRHDPWRYSHLRSFYASLFQKIKLEDLLYDGEFLKATYDMAIMFPMIEMAREHCYFVPDVLYVYNYQSPLNDAKVREKLQQEMETHIRNLPKYERLETLFEDPVEDACDVVVFSYNRPLQLYAFFESFYNHVEGYRKVIAICRRDAEYREGYELVKRDFPDVIFLEQEHPPKDFKELTLKAIFGKEGEGANHVIFAVDDVVIKGDVNLREGMKELKEKGAYAFFYKMGEHVNYCYTLDVHQGVPAFIEFSDDLYGWVFNKGKADWAYPNTLDFALYQKEEIREPFFSLEYTNPNYLEGHWSRLANLGKIGLCHKESRALNIPTNVVSTFKNRAMHAYSTEELNQFLIDGLKMNVEIFEGMKNTAVHTEVELEFVPRKI